MTGGRPRSASGIWPHLPQHRHQQVADRRRRRGPALESRVPSHSKRKKRASNRGNEQDMHAEDSAGATHRAVVVKKLWEHCVAVEEDWEKESESLNKTAEVCQHRGGRSIVIPGIFG